MAISRLIRFECVGPPGRAINEIVTPTLWQRPGWNHPATLAAAFHPATRFLLPLKEFHQSGEHPTPIIWMWDRPPLADPGGDRMQSRIAPKAEARCPGARQSVGLPSSPQKGIIRIWMLAESRAGFYVAASPSFRPLRDSNPPPDHGPLRDRPSLHYRKPAFPETHGSFCVPATYASPSLPAPPWVLVDLARGRGLPADARLSSAGCRRCRNQAAGAAGVFPGIDRVL